MKLNTEKVKEFYEKVPDVWPVKDEWHKYSKKRIESYLSRRVIDNSLYILNAGSGGNTYGLQNSMHHFDIAKNKIEHFKEFTVGTIEALPFENETFDIVICVGSVINYTDAFLSIQEISRVLKYQGMLILEFESSWGLEYLNTDNFKKNATIVEVNYYNEKHKQWIYSPNYLLKILKNNDLKICRKERFHILSSYIYSKCRDENHSAKYTKYDNLLKRIPYINLHSNNVIYECRKL